MSKFYCKDYRLMGREDLDENIALCFFIRSKTEMGELSVSIDKLGFKYSSNLIRNYSEEE